MPPWDRLYLRLGDTAHLPIAVVAQEGITINTRNSYNSAVVLRSWRCPDIRRSTLFRSPPPEDVAQALYQAFYGKTLRHVTNIIGDRECAIEATQEAFVRALERFGTLRDQDKFGPWVGSIALNAARDMLRRRNRELPDDEAVLRHGSAGAAVEEIACSREDVGFVHEAIALLPVQFRDVVTLYYIGELDVASIAKTLGVPEGTVKSRLHRGRAWLREFIKRRDEPGEEVP